MQAFIQKINEKHGWTTSFAASTSTWSLEQHHWKFFILKAYLLVGILTYQKFKNLKRKAPNCYW